MDHRSFFRSLAPLLFLMIVLIFSGCSRKDSSEASSTFTPGSTHVLVPEADGSKTIGGDPLLLDLSHTDQGYFIGIITRKEIIKYCYKEMKELSILRKKEEADS